MKKICLVVVGLYLQLLNTCAQTADTSAYKSRKLSIEEINFVHSYYHQNGDHSAVTGGIGTQQLSDYANNINLNLTRYNKRNRKINWDINIGLDYYTSASSDKIDPNTISSASHEDIHFYPTVTRTATDEQKGVRYGYTASIATESDYYSSGFGGSFAKKSKDRNREFEVSAKCYLDLVRIILPYELRTPQTGGLYGYPNEHDYPYKSRNTYSASFSLSQIINQRLQVLLLMDLGYQQGYLSLPFHRIYFKDNSENIEHLPSGRFKIPAAIRASYFLGNRFIVRSYYRFYQDDWGLTAHTIDNEIAIKLTPFFSVTPFYRFYTQTAIDYFAPYKEHMSTEMYYSSDYDVAAFNSHFYGTGVRFAPLKGLFGNPNWNLIELRYGHYTKTDGFVANVISLNVRYK